MAWTYNPFGNLQEEIGARLVEDAGVFVTDPLAPDSTVVASPGATNAEGGYTYRIVFKNGRGRTKPSEAVVAQALTAGNALRIVWTAPDASATAVEIWRSYNAGPLPLTLRLLATLATNVVEYLDHETNLAFAARSGASPELPTENMTQGDDAANYITPVPLILEVKGDVQNKINLALGRKGFVEGSTHKIGAAITTFTPRWSGVRTQSPPEMIVKCRITSFINNLANDSAATGLQVDPILLQTAIMAKMLSWNRGPAEVPVHLIDADSLLDEAKGELLFWGEYGVPLIFDIPE